MASTQHEFNHVYVLHGCGGLTVVQARLAKCGLFYSSFWDPSPPNWRFRYLSYLKLDELACLLSDVKDHFVIRLFQDESGYADWFVSKTD